MSGALRETSNRRLLTDISHRSIVNEAAERSSVKPMVNMGQGFFGYNPPEFVLDAARDALGRVECNQYSPTKVSGVAAQLNGMDGGQKLSALSRVAHD